MADAQHRLERLVGRGLQVGELRHDVLDGAAWHRARDEEVDGQGDPGRDGIEAEASGDEGHQVPASGSTRPSPAPTLAGTVAVTFPLWADRPGFGPPQLSRTTSSVGSSSTREGSEGSAIRSSRREQARSPRRRIGWCTVVSEGAITIPG